MNTEYLKNLFTKKEIEDYNNIDVENFDNHIITIKIKKEFNKFLKEIYTETKLYRSNNIEYLLNQVCNFFKNIINLEISYNIYNYKSYSLKTMNIVF